MIYVLLLRSKFAWDYEDAGDQYHGSYETPELAKKFAAEHETTKGAILNWGPAAYKDDEQAELNEIWKWIIRKDEIAFVLDHEFRAANPFPEVMDNLYEGNMRHILNILWSEKNPDRPGHVMWINKAFRGQPADYVWVVSRDQPSQDVILLGHNTFEAIDTIMGKGKSE